MTTSVFRQTFYETLHINSLTILIKAAATCERFEDVWRLFPALIAKRMNESSSLTKDETVIFDTAFGQIFGALRSALRSLTDSSAQYYLDVDINSKSIQRYIESLKKELHKLCDSFITLSGDKLIPNATKTNNYHNLCAFYKLYANVYRYKCKYPLSEQEKESDIIIASQLYTQLHKLCSEHLSITDYTHLSAMICYAVFENDIVHNHTKAIEISQSTFDAAINCIKDDNHDLSTDCEQCLQIIKENISLYKEDLRQQQQTNDDTDDDYNDGVDIMKYGKRVKATQHDPNNAQDLHDMKADMKRLGLMPQNKNNPENPMDEIRDYLHEIFMEIAGNDAIYKDVIDLILKYEAFIDLSRFQCIECKEYFGCDVFQNLCSGCFEKRYGAKKRKEICKHNMQDIAMRIEWDDNIANQRYYDMINMASLCSIKIMFRILNRNGYKGKWLKVMDDNSVYMHSVERYDTFKKEEDQDEEWKTKRKLNERCITDFGVVALAAIFICL